MWYFKTLCTCVWTATDAVISLSRRKHGFESRRARHSSLSIRPRLEGYAAGVTSERSGGSRYGCLVSSVQDTMRVVCDRCM